MPVHIDASVHVGLDLTDWFLTAGIRYEAFLQDMQELEFSDLVYADLTCRVEHNGPDETRYWLDAGHLAGCSLYCADGSGSTLGIGHLPTSEALEAMNERLQAQLAAFAAHFRVPKPELTPQLILRAHA